MVAYFHLQKFLFACDSGHFLTKVKVYARQMHVSILVIFIKIHFTIVHGGKKRLPLTIK